MDPATRTCTPGIKLADPMTSVAGVAWTVTNAGDSTLAMARNRRVVVPRLACGMLPPVRSVAPITNVAKTCRDREV